MKNEDTKLIERLTQHRTPAPDGFADRVMAALPSWKTAPRRKPLPVYGRWLIPAFTGSMMTLLLLFSFGLLRHPSEPEQIAFRFELHAPEARRVELLGTFNDWQAGSIVLTGPDASGHWITDVKLPAGRHEYIFLVDGKEWVPDPKASLHRPDGFGRENTVITIYEDENV
jgi:hypothetical protein